VFIIVKILTQDLVVDGHYLHDIGLRGHGVGYCDAHDSRCECVFEEM